MINKGNFGYSELNDNILNDITKSRIALYKDGIANVVKKNIKKFASLSTGNYTMGFLIKKI